MSEPSAGAVFETRRVLPHVREAVFAAFATREVLARWWGPSGFTTTFEQFEFRPGGQWKYVMHGPDGTHHPNVSRLRELRSPESLVLEHISAPRFALTVQFAEQDGRTTLKWMQVFEDPAVAARLRHIVEPANEQNLDRLAAVLAAAVL
ncbi:MAG: SRPBCC domain-containing protein [Gemmatimonadaceae bacterium]